MSWFCNNTYLVLTALWIMVGAMHIVAPVHYDIYHDIATAMMGVNAGINFALWVTQQHDNDKV